ncbi:hypothetical protein BDW74DRAFT_180140 [Aspergillus multicolor]|uniref:uncharacterized protein n=1 Tax=Aspergillus multicolor TaxID=41759 RepID=UPI003CCE32F2
MEISKAQTHTRPLPDEPADIAELLSLIQLHEIAVWLLNDYSRNVPCPFWTDESTWSSKISPLKFSAVEKARFLRAFYRLQTFSNLFGYGEHPLESSEHPYHNPLHPDFSEFECDEIRRVFFGPFPPWEYEEIGCLWQYCYNRNGKIYTEIANDLSKYGSTVNASLPDALTDTLLPSAQLCETDDFGFCEEERRDCLASLGPAFLYKLLRADFMTRRNLLYANAGRASPYFPHFLPWEFSEQYPLLDPADRFDFGKDVGGLKTCLSTLTETERPNVSWDFTWLEQLHPDEPLYEHMYMSGTNHRRWGWLYTMWDNERLSDWSNKYGAPLRYIGDDYEY